MATAKALVWFMWLLLLSSLTAFGLENPHQVLQSRVNTCSPASVLANCHYDGHGPAQFPYDGAAIHTENKCEGQPVNSCPLFAAFAKFLAAEGGINYGALDALGRPTGVTATITEDMIGSGTAANPSIIPPGWSGNGTLFNEARGHLLGAQLGGSGDVAENLVTLQQNPANSPIMSGFEYQVRAAVEGGQTINYSATPIYNGLNLAPRGITIMGTGSDGFNLGVTVLNPIGR